MPYARPTLTALENQAVQDITTSGVPGLFGLLRNAVLRVMAWVMSAFAYSIYGYIDWIARQSVPFTATDEFLFAWGGLIGTFPKDATGSTGSALFNGLPGKTIPSGSVMNRQDGIACVSTADATTDPSGAVTVPIASTDVGADTDCAAGLGMSLGVPVDGINAGGLILAPGMTGGADQETQDEFRTRMLAKYRDPPQGGAAADYQIWALEVSGVTRAWTQPNGMGPGSVVVRVMLDDAEAAAGGFPQGTDGCASEETRGPTATGDQLAVAEHIWPVQPIPALVYVVAPVPAPINVTLQGLDPNTTDMLTAIAASLGDMFLVDASPGGVIYPSQIYEAILATPGILHFTVTSPNTPTVAAPGALPVLGTLTALP